MLERVPVPSPKKFNQRNHFSSRTFANAGRTAISLIDGKSSCRGFIGGFLDTRWNYRRTTRGEMAYEKVNSMPDCFASKSVLSPVLCSCLLDLLGNLRNRLSQGENIRRPIALFRKRSVEPALHLLR